MGKLGRSQLMIIALLVASLGYVTHESAYAATFDLTWANHIQYDDNGGNNPTTEVNVDDTAFIKL